MARALHDEPRRLENAIERKKSELKADAESAERVKALASERHRFILETSVAALQAAGDTLLLATQGIFDLENDDGIYELRKPSGAYTGPLMKIFGTLGEVMKHRLEERFEELRRDEDKVTVEAVQTFDDEDYLRSIEDPLMATFLHHMAPPPAVTVADFITEERLQGRHPALVSFAQIDKLHHRYVMKRTTVSESLLSLRSTPHDSLVTLRGLLFALKLRKTSMTSKAITALLCNGGLNGPSYHKLNKIMVAFGMAPGEDGERGADFFDARQAYFGADNDTAVYFDNMQNQGVRNNSVAIDKKQPMQGRIGVFAMGIPGKAQESALYAVMPNVPGSAEIAQRIQAVYTPPLALDTTPLAMDAPDAHLASPASPALTPDLRSERLTSPSGHDFLEEQAALDTETAEVSCEEKEVEEQLRPARSATNFVYPRPKDEPLLEARRHELFTEAISEVLIAGYFDVVAEAITPPPGFSVRVCKHKACSAEEDVVEVFKGASGKRTCRHCHQPLVKLEDLYDEYMADQRAHGQTAEGRDKRKYVKRARQIICNQDEPLGFKFHDVAAPALQSMKQVAMHHRQQSQHENEYVLFTYLSKILDQQLHLVEEGNPDATCIRQEKADAMSDDDTEEDKEVEEGCESDDEECAAQEALARREVQAPIKAVKKGLPFRGELEQKKITPSGTPAAQFVTVAMDGSTLTNTIPALLHSPEYYLPRVQVLSGGFHEHQSNLKTAGQLLYEVMGPAYCSKIGLCTPYAQAMALKPTSVTKSLVVLKYNITGSTQELVYNFIFSCTHCQHCQKHIDLLKADGADLHAARDRTVDACFSLGTFKEEEVKKEAAVLSRENPEAVDDALPAMPTHEAMLLRNMVQVRQMKFQIEAEVYAGQIPEAGTVYEMLCDKVMGRDAHYLRRCSIGTVMQLGRLQCCITPQKCLAWCRATTDKQLYNYQDVLLGEAFAAATFKEALQEGLPELGEACRRLLLPAKAATNCRNYVKLVIIEEFLKLCETDGAALLREVCFSLYWNLCMKYGNIEGIVTPKMNVLTGSTVGPLRKRTPLDTVATISSIRRDLRAHGLLTEVPGRGNACNGAGDAITLTMAEMRQVGGAQIEKMCGAMCREGLQAGTRKLTHFPDILPTAEQRSRTVCGMKTKAQHTLAPLEMATDRDSFFKMTCAELKKCLKERGLKESGKKEDMVGRLVDAMDEQGGGSGNEFGEESDGEQRGDSGDERGDDTDDEVVDGKGYESEGDSGDDEGDDIEEDKICGEMGSGADYTDEEEMDEQTRLEERELRELETEIVGTEESAVGAAPHMGHGRKRPHLTIESHVSIAENGGRTNERSPMRDEEEEDLSTLLCVRRRKRQKHGMRDEDVLMGDGASEEPARESVRVREDVEEMVDAMPEYALGKRARKASCRLTGHEC
jgi:hypothetical protein